MRLEDSLLFHSHVFIAEWNVLDLSDDAGYLVLCSSTLLGVIALHFAEFTLNLLNLLIKLLVIFLRRSSLNGSIHC